MSQQPLDNNDENFISRWSRKKREQQHGTSSAHNEPSPKAYPAESAEPGPAADSPPNSADELAAKQAAWRALFRQPDYHIRDGLNDYDDDFTSFPALGKVITHEMKRALKLAAEKPAASVVESAQTTVSSVDDNEGNSSEANSKVDTPQTSLADEQKDKHLA